LQQFFGKKTQARGLLRDCDESGRLAPQFAAATESGVEMIVSSD
jgi:hypothetical protein